MENLTKKDTNRTKEVVYQGKNYSYIERTKSHSGEYIYLIVTEPGIQQWVRADVVK